jgi:hypothetical protein
MIKAKRPTENTRYATMMSMGRDGEGNVRFTEAGDGVDDDLGALVRRVNALVIRR